MAIDSPVGDDGQLRVGVAQFLPMAPIKPIRPRGQSGMMMSDLLPHLAGVADEFSLLKAVVADNKAHAPAALQFHTGHIAELGNVPSVKLQRCWRVRLVVRDDRL